MQAPNGPSRASSFASNITASSPNAALLGATRAFGRPATKADTSGNGAAVAGDVSRSGSLVGNAGQRRILPQSRGQQLERNHTGDSMASVRSSAGRGTQESSSSPMSHLGLPQQPDRAQSTSPSLQAANVAAARAPTLERSPSIASTTGRAPPTARRPAAPPKPRQLSERMTDRRYVDSANDFAGKHVRAQG
jgi:hypothetical protein